MNVLHTRRVTMVVVLICLVAIGMALFNVRCTVATSGQRAAFVVCGGQWRFGGAR